MGETLASYQVPILIDQESAFGLGFLDDPDQGLIDLLYLVLIEDLLLLRQW
jgi:hypothetical protein